MAHVSKSIVVALVAVAIGCAREKSPTGPSGGSGPLTAVIQGVPFTALEASVSALHSPSTKSYTISGGELAVVARAIYIALTDVDGPGTYQLGTTIPWRYANVGHQGEVWETNRPGSSGTVMVTTVSTSRIAGTFSFVAVPSPQNPLTGTVTVTNGTFDVPVTVVQ